MKVLVSHPTGNANVRGVIDAFARQDILSEYVTTIATNTDALWFKLLPKQLQAEFLRRQYNLDSRLIHSVPLKELGRLVFGKLGMESLTKHETGKFSVDAVYHSLDKVVAKRIAKQHAASPIDAVYAYEDGALHTFKKAKALNITRVYDLPIGYWQAERELLGKEREKRPDWAVTLTGLSNSKEKLNRKDQELEYAQHILVASSFTKQTLAYFSKSLAPITVIPYGFPEVTPRREYNVGHDTKLKLLFVGGLSQRKGIAELLEAVEVLRDKVELTLIGRKHTHECIPLNIGIAKNRYIPSLPHHEVLKEMKAHDILVFPSLFEGFGLVITEAMSQGTPVITTHRTCGTDMITHQEDGWLIEPSSTESLVRQLKQILANPEQIAIIGRAAMDKARSRPWSIYARELIEFACKLNTNKT